MPLIDPVLRDLEHVYPSRVHALLCADLESLQLLTPYLEKLSVQVTGVSTGEMAIASFQTARFDLAIIATDLPDMPGTEAGCRIAEIAGDRQNWLYLTYLTAKALSPACLDIVHEGVCDVVPTPVPLDTLDARIQTIRELAAARRYASAVREATAAGAGAQEIQYAATHDSLTGLPNRRLMQVRLKQALVQASLQSKRVALLFIDLDGFKLVNDTFGHEAGDTVLCEVAHRFRGIVRDSDTVCRQGGDEFVVILPEIEDESYAIQVGQRFADAAKTPIQEQGRCYPVGASIGIATYPEAGQDIESLMRHADLALAHAKARGSGSVLSFSRHMAEEASQRMQMEAKLQQGLRNHEFELFYQPQLNFATNALIGVEALMRWRHEGKLIYPDKFIPVAEESGLILPMSEWAIQEAARQHAAWRAQYGWSPTISVNITANGFSERLVSHLKAVLARQQVPLGGLALELTESMLATDVAGTVNIMAVLRDMGVDLAIDDFGTGYSAMAYLRRYPLNALKIDRAFIASLNDKRDAAVAQAILAIAKSLNLKTVAEGVETREQFDWLKSMGCDAWQGYLASPPCPAPDIVKMYPAEFGAQTIPP